MAVMLCIMCGVSLLLSCCRFIRDDAVEAEAVRQREAEAAAEEERKNMKQHHRSVQQISSANDQDSD